MSIKFLPCKNNYYKLLTFYYTSASSLFESNRWLLLTNLICDWILENRPCTHIWLIVFIGPANSHTHILPVHCCITGLSWLVGFSIHGFANHVKSRLRQWDPWRALDGRHGSDIHPCIGETSLKARQSCLGLWLALVGHIATPNSPVGGFNPTPASHPPPSHPSTPLYMQSVILQCLWKKLLKIQHC